MSIDACVAGYGVVVALAAPRVLARQRAIDRLPRLGVAAWLVAATSVLGSWLVAALSLANHPGELARGIGLGVLGALGSRLAWVSGRTWWANQRQRARHADAATLVGRHDPELDATVVDSPQPAVYCLPRSGGGLIVVTTGARSLLSPHQLRAALAHERAHLAGHHHILLAVGQALSKTVPGLRLFRQIRVEMARFLEMLADDAAARIHGPQTVATAIAAMRDHMISAPAMGAGGHTAAARALRLADANPASLLSRLSMSATVILLAAGPYLATLPHCPHPW